MKKIFVVFFIIVLFCGCSVSDDRELTQAPTECGQTLINVSDPTLTPEQTSTPTPEPTPVPSIKSVALPVVVSDYEQFLTRVSDNENSGFVTEMETPIQSLISPGDDAYYVEFNP